ncbi:MAG: sigma-70 region 4 domain-containing protein [Parasporobacterium sp.]|nr:sigma-70 region 4 domain-containing protein [Parasporobacterium sp.]
MHIVSSQLMMNVIIDFYAIAVWPAIAELFGLCKYMEVYSGDDIAWRIAHTPILWINELQLMGELPTAEVLFKGIEEDEYFGYVPEAEFFRIITDMVFHFFNRKENDIYRKCIEISKELRCIEDFDFRSSNARTDFYRKWNHSRTRFYKMVNNISEETLSEKELIDNAVNDVDEDDLEMSEHCGSRKKKTQKAIFNWNQIRVHNPGMRDDIDGIFNLAVTKACVNSFLEKADPEDYRLLMMKFNGMKMADIAAELGLETHSAVSKRLKRITDYFEEFSDIHICKKAIHRKKSPKNKN